MVKAIVVQEPGGPEVLRLSDIDVGKPGEGQVRLRQTAAGVNFIDTYHRTGLYPMPRPLIPGLEGVGVITAMGPGVTGFKIGDRVAYGNGPIGGYAEERLIPAASIVHVPASLKDEQVAGNMLRGLTVWYLLRVLHTLKPGEIVLLHAAAGGIGLLFSQWARSIGAVVIGTVSSDEKAKLAKTAGCTHVINYRTEKDWVAKVRDLSGGGVSVVYDGVGKDVFMDSLDCLRPRGLMVTFGNASGPVPAIEPGLLSTKGSLFLTRPTLRDYVANRTEYETGAAELFDLVVKGTVKIDVGQSYGLEQAAHAHSDLEARRTTGSTILVMG
jgi:NADPH2:quinone reductase